MKKAFLLLAVLLLLSACSDGVADKNVSLNLSENASENMTLEESEEQGANASLAVEEEVERSDEELLVGLEERQKSVFSERTDVLKQMRDIRERVNADNTSFEDRQFYQKAYGILDEKKSELTLEATLLESKIQQLKKRIEGKEHLEAYRNTVKQLEEDEAEYKDELKVVGGEIIKVREEWMTDYNESVRTELDELQDRERSLVEDLRDVRDQISETQDKIDEITGAKEISDDYRGLLLKRQGVSEELGVVRNKLVQKYVKLKNTEGDEAEQLRLEIDDLEDREDDLEDELRELDDKMKSLD